MARTDKNDGPAECALHNDSSRQGNGQRRRPSESAASQSRLLSHKMFVVMTPGETIYFINQHPELKRSWRELTAAQKQEVVKACETAEESDVERILDEVAHGQKRLF